MRAFGALNFPVFPRCNNYIIDSSYINCTITVTVYTIISDVSLVLECFVTGT